MTQGASIENRIDAILARDRGMPYSDTLSTFGLTPRQFSESLNFRIDYLISNAEGTTNQTLQSIKQDSVRRANLLEMEEVFVRAQYRAMMRNRFDGKGSKLPHGILIHPRNRENLAYHAIAFHNPGIYSYTNSAAEAFEPLNFKMLQASRRLIVGTLNNLKAFEKEGTIQGNHTGLKNYLTIIGLDGLFQKPEDDGGGCSPHNVFGLFDNAYRRKTGDASLFDLTQKEHLHRWSDVFNARLNYWQNPENVDEAVYHLLTEGNPLLASRERKTVVNAMHHFPTSVQKYFKTLGLGPVMGGAFETHESTTGIFNVFNKIYMRITADKSLFDASEPYHLKFDRMHRLIRSN